MRESHCRYENVKRPHRENPPITIYDTSGPFTDPNIEIDIRKGLPHSRTILDRNDVEELSESSDYGKNLNNEKTELRFEYLHKPMRAKRS
jgi:phosphomethylpyrimidine synthase